MSQTSEVSTKQTAVATELTAKSADRRPQHKVDWLSAHDGGDAGRGPATNSRRANLPRWVTAGHARSQRVTRGHRRAIRAGSAATVHRRPPAVASLAAPALSPRRGRR